jgi:hypothetical protein
MEVVIPTCREDLQMFCAYWFDVHLTDMETEMVLEQILRRLLDFGGRKPNSPLPWIKNRVRDAGVLSAAMIADDLKCGVGRLTVTLHFWNLDAPEWWAEPSAIGVVRSRISRTSQWIRPINRVANSVEQFGDNRNCPKCSRYFRNGAALRLHFMERHTVPGKAMAG